MEFHRLHKFCLDERSFNPWRIHIWQPLQGSWPSNPPLKLNFSQTLNCSLRHHQKWIHDDCVTRDISKNDTDFSRKSIKVSLLIFFLFATSSIHILWIVQVAKPAAGTITLLIMPEPTSLISQNIEHISWWRKVNLGTNCLPSEVTWRSEITAPGLKANIKETLQSWNYRHLRVLRQRETNWKERLRYSSNLLRNS